MLTLPKLDPVWADPVPFLSIVVEGNGEGGNGGGFPKLAMTLMILDSEVHLFKIIP